MTINVKDASGATVALEVPNANGRAAAASSRPVAIATEDFAALGALTETAPASDTASSGLNGRLQRIAQRLTSLIALVPASLGSKAAASSFAVTASTEDFAARGATNETAPASDTASSGLNGRLQRIAQRLTSLIALFPSAIGQQTSAGSLSVVIASDATGASPTTDGIGAALMTDKIMNGTTALTPKFVAIAASSSGNNTLLAAVTGKKIRVLAYSLMGSAAVNGKFQSGASGTDLTGLKYIAAAGGGICAPFNPAGWFETAAATLLNLNLSGAVAVGGELVYVEV